MSAQTKTMSTIKQILRLRLLGKSIKGIARTTGVSKNTVRKYLQLADSMSIDVLDMLDMEDIVLEQQFVGRSQHEEDRYQALEKQFPALVEQLGKGKGVTKWVLWTEYRADNPSGYGYSQFCYHLQQYMQKRLATMHIDHHPGDSMYVDFTGKKLHYVDQHSGEMVPVEVLVSLLGYSQYTYVEAVRSQKMEDFVGAVENSLYYFEGSPRVIVSDNLKSAVTKASRFEPEINETFLDFANHYGMCVDPARPYKPKDKPLVENAVRIIYSRVFAMLRNRTFFSLAELNAAIRGCIDQHNRTFFQGTQESRFSRWEGQEKELLPPLPKERFEIKTIRDLKVQPNCHIELRQDGHHYSAPYRYIGQQVRVIYTQSSVSIYYKGERIAFHSRSFNAGYTTVAEHMPEEKRFYLSWSSDMFIRWGASIGEEVKEYIEKVLDSKPHPQQAFKSCLGILGMARKDSKENLCAACKKAMGLGVYNYTIIKSIITHKTYLHQEDDTGLAGQYKLPLHDNIRGQSAYQ